MYFPTLCISKNKNRGNNISKFLVNPKNSIDIFLLTQSAVSLHQLVLFQFRYYKFPKDNY
ncbi:hypothetical protein SAMN04487911_1404 [Arenibacter nanhaiticus]|uniref:Uncharacterized protein n=1 Tax=Arenibacter nanhaiticus TaxID=558155 RepID=A0A1M6MBY6_9FLAO|nr:hypothetical protein SAMN04487911_1404 [Arenibacter nanhaiticus]